MNIGKRELIDRNVARVEAGNTLAARAGTAMHEILESVNRITQMVSDIAVASIEQSSGIEQVNQAIVQMDDTTQRNAALVAQPVRTLLITAIISVQSL